MFRMYGRIVQIQRFEYTVSETEYDEEGNSHLVNRLAYAPTEEEASARGTNVQPLELESDAWMDGLEVADVPNTMAEAIRIRDMGQEAYEMSKAMDKTPEQLQADIAYIAAMTGVDL